MWKQTAPQLPGALAPVPQLLCWETWSPPSPRPTVQAMPWVPSEICQRTDGPRRPAGDTRVSPAVSTARATPTTPGRRPFLTPLSIASGWASRKRAPVGETESRNQSIGKDQEGAEAPSLAFAPGASGEGWGGGEGHCPNARKHQPRPTWLSCVHVFRGPVGNLSVFVAAWEPPLGKVLKIHSIVVYYSW